MKSWKLIFWCGVAYAIILVLARGTLSAESSPTLLVVGLPLIVIAVVLARDLSRRSTVPSFASEISSPIRLREDPVRFLSGQIQVAASASESYFDDVIRSRLKELLITKVSLETGMDKDQVRRYVSDQNQSRVTLHNPELYRILYGPVPRDGRDRIAMIDLAIEEIGGWQG